jgi:hypothetical protein
MPSPAAALRVPATRSEAVDNLGAGDRAKERPMRSWDRGRFLRKSSAADWPTCGIPRVY